MLQDKKSNLKRHNRRQHKKRKGISKQELSILKLYQFVALPAFQNCLQGLCKTCLFE